MQLKASKQVTISNQSQETYRILATVITQSQMHANKALSSTSTGFDPYFGWHKIYMQNTLAKVGIKSCRCGG